MTDAVELSPLLAETVGGQLRARSRFLGQPGSTCCTSNALQPAGAGVWLRRGEVLGTTLSQAGRVGNQLSARLSAALAAAGDALLDGENAVGDGTGDDDEVHPTVTAIRLPSLAHMVSTTSPTPWSFGRRALFGCHLSTRTALQASLACQSRRTFARMS